MFDATIETIERNRVLKYKVTADEAPLSFANVIKLWEFDHQFREFYSHLLANSSFSGFRWETPALTRALATRPFEFVLLSSPGFCSRAADTRAFASYFTNDDTNHGIVNFDNLGGDSTMIVPSPRGSESLYGHFADFIRGAPPAQIDALWRVIGNLAAKRISNKPLWINTAGGGVAWLHVRLDSRPKYYGYSLYKNIT